MESKMERREDWREKDLSSLPVPNLSPLTPATEAIPFRKLNKLCMYIAVLQYSLMA